MRRLLRHLLTAVNGTFQTCQRVRSLWEVKPTWGGRAEIDAPDPKRAWQFQTKSRDGDGSCVKALDTYVALKRKQESAPFRVI